MSISLYSSIPSKTWEEEADCAVAAKTIPMINTAWDSTTDPMSPQAIEICESCPVRELCLIDAVRDPMSQGIRGGFMFSMGRIHFKDEKRIKKLFPSLRQSRLRLSHLSAENRESLDVEQ